MSVGWLSLPSVVLVVGEECVDRKIQSAAWTEAMEGKLQPEGRLKNGGQACDSGTRWAPAAPALKTSQTHSSSCEKLAVSLHVTWLWLLYCLLLVVVFFSAVLVKLGG